MLSLIPAAERPYFSQFKEEIQQDVARVLPFLKIVDSSKSIASAIVEQAAAAGMAEGTFRRKYYAWKKGGCKALVPANKVPKYLVAKSPRITAAFIAEWRRRVENVQRRAMRQAWNDLLRDVRKGDAIPGLAHWTKMWAEDFPDRPIPSACPLTWIPAGLTYNNLRGYAPTKFELVHARQGRRAAAAHRPLVATTRAGLKCGQIYVFDDMWHDHKVNFFDREQSAAIRPLEFHCIDLFSTKKVAWGIRPRLINGDGTHDQLKDREMRQLVCQVLCVVGYRAEGTTLDVENGTAKIGGELAEYIDYATDGAVGVQRGGIDKRALLAGAFAPRGVGNFRFKASLESLGGLYHNALAALPGQTGLSPAMQPESLDGLDKYNSSVLDAVKQLSPERAARLWFPVLEFNEFCQIYGEIIDRIDSRTRHDLEGWGPAGNVVEVFVPGPGLDPIPMDLIMANADKFAGAIQLAHADPARFVAFQRLSPNAVWNRGAKDLARVSIIHAPAILGRDNGVHVKISRSHEAWVAFKETHARIRYSPECRQFNTPFSNILPAGGDFIFYPVPGDLRAVVCDADNRPIGWTVQMSVANKADKQSILKAHGEAEHVRSLLESGYRERHAPEAAQIQSMRAHNDAVKDGTIDEPARADAPAAEDSPAYTQIQEPDAGPSLF